MTDKEDTTHMGAPQHVFQVYIRATPERLWQAITDPAMTQIYYFNSRIESDFNVGSPLQYKQPDGSLDIDGEVLESDPPRKLVQTWRMLMDPTMEAEGFTRLTHEIEALDGGVTKLTVIHELDGAPTLASMVAGESESSGAGGGWAWVLSDLKTVLESGSAMAS